jgi:hypothetical protein
MIDQLDYNTLSGSFSEPFANKNLELEMLASQLLSGVIYNPDFIQLVSYLSDYKDLVLLGDEFLTEHNKQLKSLLVKNDRLDIEAIKKLYYGENDKVLQLFIELLPHIKHIQPIIVAKDYDHTLNRLSQVMESTPVPMLQRSDYQHQGFEKSKLQEITKDLNQALETIKVILSILSKPKDPCDEKFDVSFSYKKLPLILYYLKAKIEIYNAKEIYYVGVCLKIIDTILRRYPKLDKDPYQKDVFMDVFSLLKYPLNAYRKLKSMISIDDTLPIILHRVYPEIMKEVIGKYFDVRDHLSYQQQLKIDRGLGVLKPIGDLASLCEIYLYKGYNEK